MHATDVTVESIIREELRTLADELLANPPRESHDVFLAAIAPTMKDASTVTRSITSRLGTRMANIARRAATLRYGVERTPSHLYGPGVDGRSDRDAVREGGDTVIHSRYDPEAILPRPIG